TAPTGDLTFNPRRHEMSKALMVLVLVLMTATAWANDTGLKGLATGAGKMIGQSAADKALNSLTQKLKNVQNAHGPIRFVTGKAEIDPACDPTMQQIAAIITEYPGLR